MVSPSTKYSKMFVLYAKHQRGFGDEQPGIKRACTHFTFDAIKILIAMLPAPIKMPRDYQKERPISEPRSNWVYACICAMEKESLTPAGKLQTMWVISSFWTPFVQRTAGH